MMHNKTSIYLVLVLFRLTPMYTKTQMVTDIIVNDIMIITTIFIILSFSASAASSMAINARMVTENIRHKHSRNLQ